MIPKTISKTEREILRKRHSLILGFERALALNDVNGIKLYVKLIMDLDRFIHDTNYQLFNYTGI